MRQPCFCYLLIVFISIPFPVNQILRFPSLFSVLPNFFHLIFLFFINNCWWRCRLLMLSFELWLHTLCQQVFIEYVMNHPSFWKLQFKCSWSNVLRDFEWSISFIVQLLWGSVQMDILVKIVNDGLDFYFHFSFYFILFCFSFFSIFRTTWVRVYQSRCHISHKLKA